MDNNIPSEFEQNISSQTNERLCEIVICFRYMGIMQEEALMSMKELAKRRVEGSAFEFEKYIKENYDTLPKLDTNMKSLMTGSMLGGLFSMIGGTIKK